MNKHLLSLFVLIVFTALALFPASTKSITAHSKVPTVLTTHHTRDFQANQHLPSVTMDISTLPSMGADVQEVDKKAGAH